MSDLNRTAEKFEKLQKDHDRMKTLLLAVYEQYKKQVQSNYSIGIDEMELEYDECTNDYMSMMTDIEILFDLEEFMH